MVGSPSLIGTSVLAYAYQLKVQSKNPKDVEYWFFQQTMSKIRNVLLNSPMMAHAS